MTRVALVTATAALDLDEDMPPLRRALTELGADAEPVVWDERGVDWSAFDVVVLRSAWDYALRRDELLAWADDVAAVTTLHNPPSVLRWSTDKHYLRDLLARGVPTVPTLFFEPGDPVHVPAVEVVVKPAIGAGSVDADRYPASERKAAKAHVERLLAEGRSAMVQPYLQHVDEHGETALVFLDGSFSHSIRKGPILRPGGIAFAGDGLFAVEDISPRPPTAAELEVGMAAVAAIPSERPLLYGRVDVVHDDDGQPVVLELELAEPSVFLDHADGAAARFARAILTAAR